MIYGGDAGGGGSLVQSVGDLFQVSVSALESLKKMTVLSVARPLPEFGQFYNFFTRTFFSDSLAACWSAQNTGFHFVNS
jgi:hypothetical protein